MKLSTIFLNIGKRIISTLSDAKDYSDTNLATAEDYTDDLCTDLIKATTYTSASASRAGNSAGKVDISFTAPSGYKFLSVGRTASHGNVIPSYCSGYTVSGTTYTANVWWHNYGSNAETCAFSVIIFFIKDVGGGNT